MALTTCSDCGHQVSRSAKHCMQCGAPLYALENIKVSRFFGWAIAGIAVVSFSYMFYDPTGYATPPVKAPVFKTVAERNDIIAKATAGLQRTVVHDSMTSYTVAAPAKRSSALGAYLAVHNGKSASVRAMPVYVGPRPIGFNSVSFTVDGVMAYKKTFGSLPLDRESHNGASVESIDFTTSPIELQVLRRVAAAENAMLTFHGKGKPREVMVTREQADALKTVLEAYDKLQAAL